MKRFFKATKFRDSSFKTISLCNDIIEDYMLDDLVLTLRQLYYQLVSRALIPNTERSYKNLGSVVSNARLAGLMDWDAIEDRGRRPVQWAEHESIQDAVHEAMEFFRLPRQVGQQNYVELWVEKEALAGVLQPIASQFHVALMVNKGYSSQSAMYASARRIDEEISGNGSERGVILYLGDLDPSGEDMVRDITDRLRMFCILPVSVKKLALTMSQVEHHQPPPNPTKLTDSRAPAFIKRYGYESWEVDALPPKELRRIIERAMGQYIDLELYESVKHKERRAKENLREVLEAMEVLE